MKWSEEEQTDETKKNTFYLYFAPQINQYKSYKLIGI